MLLEQGGALGDEGSAMFRPVLVRRTDDLDRGYQPAMPLGVIDPHLVLVLLRQVDGDVKSRPRRCPDRRRHATARCRRFCGGRIGCVRFIGRHVDLSVRPQVDAGRGHVRAAADFGSVPSQSRSAMRRVTRPTTGNHRVAGGNGRAAAWLTLTQRL